MQQSISSKLSEFGKTVSSVAGPTANSTAVMVQANVGKALVGAESGLKAVASVVSDPNQRQGELVVVEGGVRFG